MEKYYSQEILEILNEVAKTLISSKKVDINIKKECSGRVLIEASTSTLINLKK